MFEYLLQQVWVLYHLSHCALSAVPLKIQTISPCYESVRVCFDILRLPPQSCSPAGEVSRLSHSRELIRADSPAVCISLMSQTGPPRCRGMFRGITSPTVLCHKEPARASKAPYKGLCNANNPHWWYFACSSLVLYGIRKVVFCVPKPQVGGFGCPSWFIYGIRLLAKQFLGTFLDIEVDQSEVRCLELCLYGIKELTTQISTTDP